MILAMVGRVLPAASGRLPNAVAITWLLVLLLAGPAYDRWSRGRVHAVYRWGIPLTIASVPLSVAVGRTETWRAVAAWLIR